jgi:hypothetical protein
MRWIRIEHGPCEWCAIWLGPHEHSLRDDGTLGNLVRPITQEGDKPLCA